MTSVNGARHDFLSPIIYFLCGTIIYYYMYILDIMRNYSKLMYISKVS